MNLNENNIQAPFQYKISENTFELKTVSGGFYLDTDNVQVKVFSGQRLFCADIGYAVDGAVKEMEFLIDDIKVYPQVLESLKDLQAVEVKDNEVYLIRNELDFKSIVFFPPSDLNKKFDFTITTYSSTFSSFMFDDIAKKLNTLDINYPIKNYYENTDYKINDIIKYNGYLYRVFKDFTGDSTDYYIKTNCNLITPFKKLELNNSYKVNELIEYNNNFFIVQKDFLYQKSLGVLTNLNGLLKPLQDIIIWFDGISKIYKNQIVIKDNFSYIVLEDIENPVWGNIQSKLDYLNKASNTFYDDSNSSFGNNTNTVQKAIEKLKSNKQDSLIVGNNINLNGNTISVDGGTSKEYIIDNSYFINDLIIKDDRIYKANEDFIASDFNIDIGKLTLISSGGGGASAAIDVSFDNSNSNLEYFSGYDFPKYKKTIPNTINLVLSNGTSNYNASIVKQSDGSYRLKCNISNFNISGGYFSLSIKNVNNLSNIYQRLSFLSQFFNIQTIYTTIDSLNYINLEASECVISSLNFSLKFALIYSDYNKSLDLIIKIDSSSIQSGSYNITLNIKNRVLKPEDRNIFAYSDPFMGTQNIMDNYILSLSQNNSSIKLTGSYTLKQGAGLCLGFYSPIIEKYFNVSDTTVSFQNTSGITSSSGKAIKFGFYKNSSAGTDKPLYLLFLMYQDDTDLQVGEKITFNLAPSKNSTLNPIYQDPRNVQQAIETIVNDKIPDVYDYSGTETLTNKIAKVDGVEYPVYRRCFEVDYQFIGDGEQHYVKVLTIKGTCINYFAVIIANTNTETMVPTYDGNNIYRFLTNRSGIQIAYKTKISSFVKYRGFGEYIKTYI